jgi:predicted transcriptional regulator
MTTAGEFCNPWTVVAKADESLIAVARRMLNEHVGCVVVVEERAGKSIPIGMLTDRDIVVGVIARSDGDIDTLMVGDAMTKDVVVASGRDNLDDVLKRMCARGIRRIAIVDEMGSLHGLIAFDDILERLQDQVATLVSVLKRERQQEIDTRPRIR